MTRSKWARLVLGMVVTDDARLKLETAERQQAKIGNGTAGKLACAEAAEIISSHHSAQIAVKAHLKLYLCTIVVPGAIWKAAALALRENVIMHCCSHTGGNGTFPDIEAMLLEMYGVDRFGKARNNDLRGQLHKCFDHFYPGARNLHKRARRPRRRSQHGEQERQQGTELAPTDYQRHAAFDAIKPIRFWLRLCEDLKQFLDDLGDSHEPTF